MNESAHWSQILVLHLPVIWEHKIYWPVCNDQYSITNAYFKIYENKATICAGAELLVNASVNDYLLLQTRKCLCLSVIKVFPDLAHGMTMGIYGNLKIHVSCIR
jgi:hypothetical protein